MTPLPKEAVEKAREIGNLLDKTIPEPNSGCWLWTGSVNYRGYGQVRIAGRTEKAHRAVYAAIIGPIPKGMLVLHRCDVPSCVNPDHLWIGTDADNNADMRAKGRGVYPAGERNGRAKLSATDVEVIRGMRGAEIQKDTAARFGVSKSLVGQIQRGEKWSAEWFRRQGGG